MQDHQFLRTLPSKRIQDVSVLGLWLIPIPSVLKPITIEENELAAKLHPNREKQYRYSRGYARHVLAELSGRKPLDIPLQAIPGKPPELAKDWGYISFSYCKNALIIGWSPKKIGIDIEISERDFNANQLVKRYFCKKEKKELANVNSESLRIKVLTKWVVKEAAIKWQKGGIYTDLRYWEIDEENNIAKHQLKNKSVGFKKINYGSWLIAIALDATIDRLNPMLCLI